MTLRLAGALALAAAAFAPGPVLSADRPPPKLIVAISVDQFSADLFAQYRQHFSGGLRRLADGVVFPSGYQSHNMTETCPGHSTILTGARPARTGIIANDWFDQNVARADKQVYCSEDPTVPRSTFRNYSVSTHFLKVPALGDRMKAADPRARSVAVAGKDRAAIMMGGYGPDQRWYWTGGSYAFGGKAPPAAAGAAVNAGVAAALARPMPAMPLPEVCAAQSRAVPVAGGGKPVGTGRFARAAGDERGFRTSPEFDAATLALATALRDEMRLGEGPATDILAVGLSATDYVGHTYGTEGSEMCLQVLTLDRLLGDFFRGLDATGVDYVVMLTADHGGNDIPERENAHAIPGASRAADVLSPGPMGRALAAKLHLQGPVLLGSAAFGDIYIDKAIPGAMRQRVLREAIAAYRAHPQVAAVFTRAEIGAAPPPSGPPETWSLVQRARASFDPERSGDFVVQLKPRVTPLFDTTHGYVATHGSPWDYDRRVPILFWRKGIVPFEQPLSVETVDIMPTLAALIGLRVPADEIDGRCLDIEAGPASTCAAP
jgi:predicted AlkP superfamily pyrophosphatase or phosphodiesterase